MGPRNRSARWLGFLSTIAVVFAVACSVGGGGSPVPSSDASFDANVRPSDAGEVWAYDGPRSACSDGPPADDTHDLPEGTFPAGLPDCVPRCGSPPKITYAPFGTAFPREALPSGHCDYAGEACQMTTLEVITCSDGSILACSLTGFACRCEGGGWSCYAGPRGGSVCGFCPRTDGGGADAAPDH